jgi:predicted short-subunit dehydrogenase-like oxidoreductase (DUF2520 family)
VAKNVSIAVVGAGNFGSSLIAGLRAAGLEPVEMIRRNGWRRVRLDAGLIWICVPDGAIASVAEKIAARRGNLRGQIVVHSSGALSAEVLEPVWRAGARIAAVHPVMSFPSRRIVSLTGVMFGVEAADAAVRRELFSLLRRFGGAPFPVKAETKALYHAAGIMASPLLVAELTAAVEMAGLAGLSTKAATAWIKALSEATIANVFAHGPRQSFSGPFARGDAETIRLHLGALEKHRILADVYRSLARYAVEAATLPVKNRGALKRAISSGSARKLK